MSNGKEYCLEIALTEGERDACSLELEDAVWSGNRDKERIVELVAKSLERIRLTRNPCGWWRRHFDASCKVTPLE